jgi:signal transduction histidine kinase/ligand-binding sensor domain-containing protein
MVNPSRLSEHAAPAATYIESVIVDRKTLATTASLLIPPNPRDLQIEYTSPALLIPQKVKFRYRLEGYEHDWHEAGTRRQAFYTDLPPGQYSFRVIASNSDGIWNENGTTLDFSIARAYYQTRWFEAAIAVGVFALLYVMYQLRIRRIAWQFNRTLDARVSERTRIARELHDTLLQSFHGALLRFQSASNVLPAGAGEAKERLERALDQAEAAITEGRNAVQGLRASATTLNDLANGIAMVGAELTSDPSASNPPAIEVDVVGESRDLNPVVRDEAYRIAGEALRNAFKHAQARQIVVTIHYEARQLCLTIRDDGTGMDEETMRRQPPPGHFGLPGMRERAAIVRGRLEVRSAVGSGTEIELRIPSAIAYRARAGRRWSRVFRSGRLTVIALLAASALSQPALANGSPPVGQRIVHESWTFKQGAPENVRSLAQTTDGYLWLGTPSGLFRFDGVRFELFRSLSGEGLLSTDVTAVFATRGGGLWVGYLFGGFSFVTNGRVSNFPATTGTIIGLSEDQQGIVWAATTGGLWRFDGASWQNIRTEWNAPPTRFAQVGFDREGILWALTESRGPEAKRELFFLPPGTRQFRTAGRISVQSFTWDADRFVVTSAVGSARVRGSGIALEDRLPAYPVLRNTSAQLVDRTNSIWAIPLEGPILRRPAGAPLTEIVSAMSSANSEAYDINANRFANMVDREGSVWIGDQTGVHRFSYSPLAQLELPKAPGPLSTVVSDDAGVMWVSAGNGDGVSTLYRVRDGRAEVYQQQGGVSTFAYRAPDHTLWFAGEGGLWHMVDERLTKTALPHEMENNAQFLRSMTHDGTGGMWVSFGPPGLYRFKDGVWTSYGGRSDLPTTGVVILFTDILNRVWFGSTQNRLAMLDGDHVQTFGSAEGVQVGTIGAIAGRGAAVWIGGEFGLQQFDRGRFHTIHAVDKESLRGIVGIVEATNGDLWLNGLGGIVHLLRADILEGLKNCAHQVSGDRFGRREGLPGLARQLGPIAAVEGRDGRLWFTVRNGVVSLDPAASKNPSAPPRVVIQSISADDRRYGMDQPRRFPPGTSNIQIGFSAVSLLSPEAIRFRYRLQEIDHDWQEVGTTTSVSYRNLAPGSYHFAVSATDTNGIWSDGSATTELIVLSAFYQTTWFRTFAVGLFLALLWAAYRFRIHQAQHAFDLTLEARIGERTRIARELHDTLLQSFHGLVLRFQSASTILPARPDEAKARLDRALEQAEAAMAEGRDAVQKLRASAATVNHLANGIAAVGFELTNDPSAVDAAAIEVNVDGEPRDLNPVVRDEAYRIASEALRNAFKHAHAHRIVVTIHYEARQFRLTVRDDGKGMDAETIQRRQVAGRFGLVGMHERAALVRGRLEVRSAIGSGTEIEVRIPAATAYGVSGRRSWYSRLRR